MKLGVIFGGMSTEHDVSVVSGTSIIKNVNKEKYEVLPIYIDKNGDWYKLKEVVENYNLEQENLEKITDIMGCLKKCDVVFPVLHGKYGEDGTVQGLLELLKIPYVGPGVLASAIAMDKAYAKIVFDKANLKQAKYVYLRKVKEKYILLDDELNEEKNLLEDMSQINEGTYKGNEDKKILENICEKIEEKIKYPMFVKPSNSGSSIGINKAKNKEELAKALEIAGEFDTKILVEEGIVGREIECAVLGNEDVKASTVGEIKPAEDFYSYDAKYNNSNSELTIPAKISDELSEIVRKQAIKAFKAIDGKGFSRVDFFVNTESKEIYINEINTIPGFTPISMYPKLWEYDGVQYSELIEKLISLAINN